MSGLQDTLVIDATDGVLGRVASYAAKQSMLGKKVIIVNCNKAVVTGRVRFTINEYLHKRRRGGSSMKGPFFPKQPERIMKRTVRGMLAYQQQRGLDALKRVMCYNSVPQEYASAKKVTMQRNLKGAALNLDELGKEI